MFSKISVLVPTRKRIPQLRKMLDSWASTTKTPGSAELIFRIDVDDYETKAFLEDRPIATVLIGPRYEGYRSLPLFFNEMTAVATGDVFMCGNDDMVFRTPDWSRLLLAEANKYPDGIFDLGVSTYNEGVFPWSTVSRHATELMGQLHDPRIYWGDVYLRDIMAAFGRAIHVPHVQIDHVWMGHAPDQTFIEAKQDERRNWDEAYWALHQRCVTEAVQKIESDHRVGPSMVEASCRVH